MIENQIENKKIFEKDTRVHIQNYYLRIFNPIRYWIKNPVRRTSEHIILYNLHNCTMFHTCIYFLFKILITQKYVHTLTRMYYIFSIQYHSFQNDYLVIDAFRTF